MEKRADALQRLRRTHEEVVLATLRAEGPMSRARLTKATGLSRTTLFAIISELMERGVVIESGVADDRPRQRGRPPTRVSLNPDAGLLIGVDLGRRRIRVAIANVARQIVATAADDAAADADESEQADLAIALVRKVCEDEGIGLGALEAIGVGLVGVMDAPDRRWRAVERLEAAFGARVEADNNARLAALAERTWGAAQAAEDIVYVRWSVGVGGGLISGGRLLRGAHGASGELGHVSVDPAGPPCHCGGRGCLEGRIGMPALLDALAAKGVRLTGTDDLLEAAQARTPAVTSVVVDAARTLGTVLAGTVAQLDPERVVMGGDLATLGGLVLDPIRSAIGELALPGTRRTLDIVPADLGPAASAMGAIALVLTGQDPSPPHPGPELL
ncbi:ROK family transcriptional regulator [Actinomadura sp. KC06]|uniref:ROK family transcriptional regulator n=1 Tax=Actinomadura sp. KC06 TaxID=2530369 RepID=UPI001050FF83|nr:ROK family transcriptional regulator [Actinomadura sp. KC06]TDD28037.1 ROK family transcriptional regulator [Actinomadura sp. KC06]